MISASAARVLTRAGHVLLVWAVLIALENVVVGVGYRRLFAGYWEMAAARTYLSPLLLAVLAPFACLLALLAEVASRPSARRLAPALGFAFGASAALSVCTGRHTESWAVRVPFMLAVGGGLAAVIWALFPRVLAAPPRTQAVAGAGLFAVLWSADSFVLPRLYPGFHWSCLALALPSGALVASALSGRFFERVGRVALVLSIALALYVPRAAVGVARADNLRLVLLERAPLLGRAVRIAALVAAPEPTDELPATGQPGPSEVARALDWTATDLVLVTVDALRADHVSSYGYARPTTPVLDALAARGTRFDHAYCPTPHTSYSVTSMLTGKYMKPLLTLGVGEDSDTWASLLRRYGYRTAAFYPPAVFFIDEARFTAFRDSGLGFEYRKVEFAERETRVAQVRRYLQSAPRDKALFLWVHLFEPHEPYVVHPGRTFGASGSDLDAYDSEIAEADATMGEIVKAVEERRPGATVMVTADHGEEFGDHGGRYHGTTVYEEQVRVPLVVVGKNVRTQVVSAPVQTIDLLPTALSALGIPRPARVRGRDLGSVLRDGETTEASRRGFAFAETDDFALVAEGSDRLVCARKVGACARFDVGQDPREVRDRGQEDPARTKALRARLAQTERDHGRFEGGVKMPDAIRRGRQGEVDAAEDVAALFDDASVAVRREAAEVAFALHQPATTNNARRALAREDDETTRRFLSLVLVRAGASDEAPRKVAALLLDGDDVVWKRRAALALGDGGDARGMGVLASWLATERLELEPTRELAALFARHKARIAVPALLGKLPDLRVRPYVAEALGAIGDPSARGPLLEAFAVERYHPTRVKLAAALAELGTKDELFKPLARFAGVPEPLENAISVAARAGLLVPRRGGLLPEGDGGTSAQLTGRVMVGSGGRVRVLVGTAGPGPVSLEVAGVKVTPVTHSSGTLFFADVTATTAELDVTASHPSGVRGVWVVPLAEELPPPPKEAWDGGVDDERPRSSPGPTDRTSDSGLSGDAKAE